MHYSQNSRDALGTQTQLYFAGFAGSLVNREFRSGKRHLKDAMKIEFPLRPNFIFR